jgi:regulator of RNase E activity RraB
MSTITAEEAATYRKIIDDAIKKLKKLLHNQGQTTQLFWSHFNDDNVDDDNDDNDDNDDDDDHETTELDESSEVERENDYKDTKKIIQDILLEDGENVDESDIEDHIDSLREFVDEANKERILKPTHTPPNTPTNTSRSLTLSWSAVNTPQLIHPPTVTLLLPVPPPPAPPPSSIIQTPLTGPPLLPNPAPTFSNVIHNTRPINVYNVTMNIDHNNNETDSDETDTDETNINDPKHFPKLLLKYFKDYYPW